MIDEQVCIRPLGAGLGLVAAEEPVRLVLQLAIWPEDRPGDAATPPRHLLDPDITQGNRGPHELPTR
jgi:hypothetical protein